MATDTQPTLIFFVHGRRKPWTALRSVTPPCEQLWEVSAYPGWRSAIGRTFEEGYTKLVDLLKSVLSDVDDRADWYRSEYSKLDQECQQWVDRAISHVHQQLAPEARRQVVRGTGEPFTIVVGHMQEAGCA